jgi:predicted GNAT family acetyltransferase
VAHLTANDGTVPQVDDDKAHHRLVIEQDGSLAELVYLEEPGRLILVHTEVPDALAGRGVGARLVQAAVARAEKDQATVVPWCPFARRWLRDHPDVADRVTIDWTPPSPSAGRD